MNFFKELVRWKGLDYVKLVTESLKQSQKDELKNFADTLDKSVRPVPMRAGADDGEEEQKGGGGRGGVTDLYD
jgi:hypothetical protein